MKLGPILASALLLGLSTHAYADGPWAAYLIVTVDGKPIKCALTLPGFVQVDMYGKPIKSVPVADNGSQLMCSTSQFIDKNGQLLSCRALPPGAKQSIFDPPGLKCPSPVDENGKSLKGSSHLFDDFKPTPRTPAEAARLDAENAVDHKSALMRCTSKPSSVGALICWVVTEYEYMTLGYNTDPLQTQGPWLAPLRGWIDESERSLGGPVPVVASVRTPASASPSDAMNSVPIRLDGPRAYVSMAVGIMPITVLVDTGCDDMTVSETIANWLISYNRATNAPDDEVKYADGSIKSGRAITINTVTIAGHELHNIEAGVVPDNADMLLGFSVLSQVSSKFAIDAANSRLVFE